MPNALKILITDDSESSRELLRAFLKPFHTVITTCQNGHEALKACEAEEFDLLLMDVIMPLMDGLTATEAIRELEKDHGRPPVPVILLSGNDTVDEIERYARAGVSAFLPKPITRNELLGAISEAIGEDMAADLGLG